jgi:hypothetical protein
MEVEAYLIGLFVEARKLGLSDGAAMTWVEAKCPGVPDLVLIMAAVEAEAQAVDAWWEAIEKTIDGEVIARALATPKTPEAA